jgi:hypothetical protein
MKKRTAQRQNQSQIGGSDDGDARSQGTHQGYIVGANSIRPVENMLKGELAIRLIESNC